MSTDIAMAEAFDHAIRDLEQLISRRFAARRTIRLEPCPDGRWHAIVYDGDRRTCVFPPSPNLGTVRRFVLAFASVEGVEADVSAADGFSVRVPPTLRAVK